MRFFLSPFGIAGILCAVNLLKPLVVDDAAYFLYARQIAENPLDPYGFTIIWYQWAEPAFDVLAPPVFPAWWALGLTLLGDHPILWKLWLFPFCWLLTASLHALFRRFAHGRERSLTAMTALSAFVLPSVNLMLDVPALALMLAGIALFVSRPPTFGRLLLSGLLLGIGMETKYTAFVGPAVVVLYALTHRQMMMSLVPVAVACAVFVGCESLIAEQYGRSHFLHHASAGRVPWDEKFKMAGALFGYLGGLGPGVALLAWASLGMRWRLLVGLAMGFLVTLTLIAVVPLSWQVWSRGENGVEHITMTTSLMGVWSALLLVPLAGVGLALVFRATGVLRRDPDGVFLVLWFWMEVAAYFVLSPFPAARRVMMLLIVSTLLAGRLARLVPLRAFRFVVGFGIAVGVFYAAIEIVDAWPEKRAVERVVELLDADAKVWYVGHWGFQFYADRAGWRAVHPDESELSAGDYLVVPNIRVRPLGQSIHLEPSKLIVLFREEVSVPLPFRTVPSFYGGRVPLEPHRGPRVSMTVFRVTDRWKPQSFLR